MTAVDRVPRVRTDRDRAVPALVLHSALFLVGGWLSLATSAEFAVGLYDASVFYLPLAAVLVGAVRASGRVLGGRAILLAADLGLAILFGAHALTTGERFLETSPWWFAAGVGLGVVAAITTRLLPGPALGSVARGPRDRSVLIVVLAVDVISLLGLAVQANLQSGFDLVSYLVQAAPPTLASDAVLLVAWWWGSPWLLGLAGSIGLAQVLLAAAGPNVGLVPVLLVATPNAVAVGAALVGPRLVLRPAPVLTGPAGRPDAAQAALAPAPSEPGLDAPGQDAGAARFRVVDAWIALGAFLWPLLVLFGSFPTVSDLCVECGPRFPGDSALQILGAATVPLVPIAALLAIGLSASRGVGGRGALWLLLASAVIVAIEIAAGQLGVTRFAFLGAAAAPVILVLLGSIVGLRRPSWLAHAGWVAAVAAGALTAVWALGAGAAGQAFSALTAQGFVATSFIAAAVTALGVAAESHRVRTAVAQPIA